MQPTKLSFKLNGEMKYFHGKEELKKLVTTEPSLQIVPQTSPETGKKDHTLWNNKRKKPPGRATN